MDILEPKINKDLNNFYAEIKLIFPIYWCDGDYDNENTDNYIRQRNIEPVERIKITILKFWKKCYFTKFKEKPTIQKISEYKQKKIKDYPAISPSAFNITVSKDGVLSLRFGCLNINGGNRTEVAKQITAYYEEARTYADYEDTNNNSYYNG